MAREQLWESPDWFRTLTEGGGLPGLVDPDRATRRLARWRAQPPFSAEGAWIGRLAADGLSEASFLSLLGEPDADLARWQGEPPPRLLDLERSFSNPAPQAFPTPSMPERARPHLGFLEAVRPLLDAGYSGSARASWIWPRDWGSCRSMSHLPVHDPPHPGPPQPDRK